ncbi:MAG: hypothetical protein K0M78_03965 [Brevundimonas sp.]|nr:hypothetical protein [Brevundimonas sp.]
MDVASVNLLAVATAAFIAFGLNFVWITLLFRRLHTAGLGRGRLQDRRDQHRRTLVELRDPRSYPRL